MNTKKIFSRRGFSLVELILTVAIMTIIVSIVAPITNKQFDFFDITAERENFLSVLRRARILSITNRNSSPHGVYVATTTYTVFEGVSFAARSTSYDEVYPKLGNAVISGSNQVVFSALAATTSASSFTIVLNNASSTVDVNIEGGISYK